MKFEEIIAKIEKLKTYIRDAEETIRSGKMVDLTGLDREVTFICTNALSLKPEEALNLQPHMADLIGDLETMTRSLNEFRDGLTK
ncbi:MAG: hypothetical protein DI626_06355 [Micavibrio aeruginosavorus]|uniref:Uncharacterized protein n=1 Tax=Micavibrio aeruginosavorus TaxID=349221 RepID=A0A2W4ZW42_9BACT|nr:MAG: hypothetical protein DI626_06355 [Micavibrio aeruginosavorus]